MKYLMGVGPHRQAVPPVRRVRPGSGLALRGTFIIAPDGTLFNSEVNFYNMGRNIDELMRKFKANIYLAQEGRRGLPVQVEGRGRQDAASGTRDGRHACTRR